MTALRSWPGCAPRPLFRIAALGLALLPAAAVASSDPVDPASLPLHSELGRRLQAHVTYLASPALEGREPGTRGNRLAAHYLAEQYREAGLEGLPSLDGYRQTIAPEIGDNLLGLRRATDPSGDAPWLLVGAHFDHLGDRFLGADDNASGVAILLETVRALPPLRHHHVLFAAFNAEERPYIRTPDMGSQHFVDDLPPEIGAVSRIRTAIIMDLMGGVHWPPLENVVFAAGAEQSPELDARLREQLPDDDGEEPLTVVPLGIHLVEELPIVGPVAFSDYDAFRNARVPFLFLSSGRTPRYHSPADLPDTLYYERMAATVRWLVALLERLDRDTRAYAFEPERIRFADEVARLRPLVALAADRETQIPDTSLLSHWRLQGDHDWLRGVDPAAGDEDAVTRLERISIRLQCLLGDFVGCFLF